MTKNDGARDLADEIEDHNRRAMRGDLSRDDVADLKRLLARYEELHRLANRYEDIDGALKIQERIKWVVKSIVSIAVGAPIVLAIWQLIDRVMPKY